MGVLARQRKERFRHFPASLVLLGGVCTAHQHVLHSCDVATTTFALVSRDRHCSVSAAGGHLVFYRMGSTSLFGSFEMSTQRQNKRAAANGLSAVRSSVAGIRERTVRFTVAAEAVAELGR
jgi:hypothetical protein